MQNNNFKMTRELIGEESYGGNTNKNPVTPKQQLIIDFINENSDLNLNPTNSNDAYNLIGLHYTKVKRMLMERNRNK